MVTRRVFRQYLLHKKMKFPSLFLGDDIRILITTYASHLDSPDSNLHVFLSFFVCGLAASIIYQT